MKKLLSAVLGIFLISLFVTDVEATNYASRFRGSGSRYLEKITRFTERIEEDQMPKYSRRRPRQTSSFANAANRERSLPSVTRRTTRRYSTSRIPFSRTTSNMIQGVKEKESTQVFSARLIPFTIVLPSDFEEVFDTLEWDTGSLNLKDNNNTRIDVSASSKRCDGGDTFVRTCLNQASTDFVKALRTQIPGMELIKNEDVSLNLSKVQLKKTNRGRYVEMRSSNYHVGHLTFFDPVKEYVWELKITDPRGQRGILNEKQVLQRIFSSLIENDSSVTTSSVNKKAQKLSYVVPDRRSDRGSVVQGKQPLRFDASQAQQFRAQKIPFGIELPSYLKLTSDTLDWNQGEMTFEGNNTKVVIQSTNEVCDEQTPRLKRQCIEENAAQFAQKLKMTFEGGNTLQDSNILMQLEDIATTDRNLAQSQSTKNHIGRIFMMRTSGKRAAEFTFAEPIKGGYVWNISITAPEGNDYLLNDIRQKNKMFSSIFFRAE